MDDMDEASLRRFDLKAEFQWLRDDQKVSLLKLYGKRVGLEDEPGEEEVRRLKGLTTLSPGDFSNLLSQNKFAPIGSYEDFITRLVKECSLKRSAKNGTPIGFA